MSENDVSTSNHDGQTQIRDSLIEILFDALADPTQAVRTGALRLLVRLPLPSQFWYRLAERVDNELNLYLLPDAAAKANFPFEDLLDAAVRIPVSTMRRKLYEFLEQKFPKEPRQQVIQVLAQARDRAAVDFLLPSIKKAGEINPQEAAFWLAHYDLYHQSEEVSQLAVKHKDPIVRFWLSVALLRLEDYQPLVKLVTQFLEGKFELPILWGNPFDLAQQVADCGPFPDAFLAFLKYVQSEGKGARPEGMQGLSKISKPLGRNADKLRELLPLVEALIDKLTPPPVSEDRSAEQPTQPSTPWAGSLDKLVARLMQGSVEETGVLSRLTASQKTNLITTWFAALEKRTARDEQTGKILSYPGIGNQIMELPGWFWQDFDPDLPQLYDIYLLLAPERADLMEQLAWVISRAGIVRLMEEYLPLLPLVDSAEKTSLLQILERAVFQHGRDFGPIYGAGPSTPETLPVIRHFIDYKSAAVGDEETSLTLTDEQKATRYVQGNVYDNSDKQMPQRLDRAFLAGKEHLLKVWIGELQADTIVAPLPVDLGALPDLPSWDLQVYFWEPNHAPAVQIGKLTVYQEQLPDLPVSTCEFTFTPRSDLPNFQGRLAVVYQKNVLQMLFLEGKVVADAASASESDHIRFQWAEVKGLRSPDQLQKFDLVFYNENDPVQGAGLMFFGGQAGLKQISGQEEGIREMINALKEAGAPGKPSLKAKKESLLTLAVLGSMLYTTIEEQIGTDDQAPLHLREAQRLQLVSAVRDVFPLELVYVYPPPEDGAELCPNAEQAIQIGACFTCDGLDEAKASKVICPLGFLGLRCTIERHAIQPLQQTDTFLEGKDYQLRLGLSAGGKTINPLKSSLGGTSGKVEASNRKKFTSSMQTLFPERFVFAGSWAEWKNNIKDKTFLVLIPHTLKDRSIPSLEIGNTKLWQTAIRDAVGPETKPIVLLIGCETAVPDVPYQGFAAAFSKAGAVITITTLSPIHESHAVPITEILVNQIRQSAQMQQTFSDALLQARRTAMAAGYAEVLTLVADGDADWILVEEG